MFENRKHFHSNAPVFLKLNTKLIELIYFIYKMKVNTDIEIHKF